MNKNEIKTKKTTTVISDKQSAQPFKPNQSNIPLETTESVQINKSSISTPEKTYVIQSNKKNQTQTETLKTTQVKTSQSNQKVAACEPSAVKWTAEQQRAITLRGKNIIVSASAGSGKTSVMIERAAGLIAEGHSISEMLIVTFTRAAAADIKDKLSRRLGGSPDAHVRAQLKLLAGADIGTLHSWCQRLIGRYFYETGLDPDFNVLEGRERAALFSDSMDKVIDEEYKAANPDFLDLLEILGGRDEHNIKTQLERFYEKLILRPGLEIRFDEGEAVVRLKEILTKKQARLLQKAEELYAQLAAADYQKKLAPAAELIACINSIIPPAFRLSGKIPTGLEELNDRLKGLNSEVKGFVAEYNAALNAPPPSNEYLHVLLRMARRLNEVFVGLKKSKSKADFNDLEHHALTILQSKAGEEVKGAYKFVFVDEYQDINPLQNSIIDSLCGADNLFLVGDLKQSIYAFRGCEPTIFAEKIKAFEKDPACEVIRLNANHRSVVGVLEFANRVFSSIMTEDFGGTDYAKSGRFVIKKEDDNNCDTVDKNCNNATRGTKSNNDNKTAGNTNFANDKTHSETASNEELISANDSPTCSKNYADDKSVNIYLYKEEKQIETGLYDLTLDEGEQSDLTVDLAFARILELLDKTITEKGKTRGVRQSDIAVLCRKSGKAVFALIKRLQKVGLSVNVCDKLRESAGDEIVALVEYLRLIDNRLFDRPLINSLKGHFGGFTDAELFSVRSAFPRAESFHAAVSAYISNDSSCENANTAMDNNAKDITSITNTVTDNPNCMMCNMANTTTAAIDQSLRQRLLDFFQKLDYYRQMSVHLSAEELIGKVVTDFEYFQAMFLLGEESPRLLESFLDWTSGKTEGLSQLLEIIPDAFPPTGITGEAISVITVHSSKGLEYPFVLVLDAEKRFNKRDLTRPIIMLEGLAAIRHYDWTARNTSESAVWLLNKKEYSRRQREEEMRLLYVALTRGKFCVDIFAAALDNGKYKPAEEGGCWLDWIMPLAEDYARVISPVAALPPKPAVFPPADPRLIGLLKDSFDFKVSASSLPPKTYVTALLDGLSVTDDEQYAESIYLCGENALEDGEEKTAEKNKTTDIVNSADDNSDTDKTAGYKAYENAHYEGCANDAKYAIDDTDTGDNNGRIVDTTDKQDKKSQKLGSAELGTLYHLAMELVDFYADFDKEWDGLPPEIKQNVDKGKIKTAALLVGDYLKGFKIFKEQGFIMDIDAADAGLVGNDSLLLQGVIDVLAIKDNSAKDNLAEGSDIYKGGEAVIIDYKTGELSAKYKVQLGLYAHAAKKVLGLSSIKTLIYSFSADKLLDSRLL